MWRKGYADFVRRRGRYNRGKAVGLLAVFSLTGGLLTAAATLPFLGAAGIATKDAAKTFNTLAVAGLGQLPARSELLDANGHLIAYYYPRGIYRVPVSYSQIAPVMRERHRRDRGRAVLLPRRVRPARDLAGAVQHAVGQAGQGGSTLAQQYVKNACILTAPIPAQAADCQAETVARKVRELRIAANVLQQMTRRQLLAAYLNAAYFENQAYGIQVASQFYFSTSASRLSLTQAAMLAGLVKNPVAYDPLLHPEAALDRRNVVLARMAQARLHHDAQATAGRGQAARAAHLVRPAADRLHQPGRQAGRRSSATTCSRSCGTIRLRQGLAGAELHRRHEDLHDSETQGISAPRTAQSTSSCRPIRTTTTRATTRTPRC